MHKYITCAFGMLCLPNLAVAELRFTCGLNSDVETAAYRCTYWGAATVMAFAAEPKFIPPPWCSEYTAKKRLKLMEERPPAHFDELRKYASECVPRPTRRSAMLRLEKDMFGRTVAPPEVSADGFYVGYVDYLKTNQAIVCLEEKEGRWSLVDVFRINPRGAPAGVTWCTLEYYRHYAILRDSLFSKITTGERLAVLDDFVRYIDTSDIGKYQEANEEILSSVLFRWPWRGHLNQDSLADAIVNEVESGRLNSEEATRLLAGLYLPQPTSPPKMVRPGLTPNRWAFKRRTLRLLGSNDRSVVSGTLSALNKIYHQPSSDDLALSPDQITRPGPDELRKIRSYWGHIIECTAVPGGPCR